ncbi:APC family permease, partial [Ferrimicrobium acidiphilum]|uniref:APC family permease n=3 Tax=Ferrimicrobium TaxID=121038 RepID=UPI0023F18756
MRRSRAIPVSNASHSKTTIGFLAATALGIGGMLGAGLYTLLGLAATSTGSYLPVAFAVGGIVSALSVYSYARLGSKFPSRGGAAHFIVQEYGNGTIAGALNIFQYLGYLIATSLYATGFAEYVGALMGNTVPPWAAKVFAAAIVLAFLAVNIIGSRLVGHAEIFIVAIEIVILIGLVLVGLHDARPARLISGGGQGTLGIITGAAVLYVTYEGFGVVTNASNRMTKPRTELPRAMFAALAVVTIIYVMISALVVAILPEHTIIVNAGHVLANAGQVAIGRIGFVAVAVAAILATSSAVNATLFAASNVAFDEARSGELPHVLTSTVGRNGTLSLLVSAGIVILLVLFFPLDAVAQMTSLAFLVIYGAVSSGHLRVRAQTGARAWPLVVAGLFNLVLFA